MDKAPEGYRPGVCAIIYNDNLEVLLCQRRDAKDWQFPQGGTDGEDLETALIRELYEETGLSHSLGHYKIISHTSDWITYRMPSKYRRKPKFKGYIGQAHIYFLVKWNGALEDLDFTIDNEFVAARWCPVYAVYGKFSKMKTDAYTLAIKELLPEIIKT